MGQDRLRIFVGFVGELFAFLDRLFRDEPGAIRRDLGLYGINFVADIHAIGDGFFVAVIADDVVLEDPVGPVVRGGGETDQKGVEEEDIVGRTHIGLILADRDARTGAETIFFLSCTTQPDSASIRSMRSRAACSGF